MKKILFIIFTSLSIMSCNKSTDDVDCTDLNSPVSLDEVLDAYEKNDTSVAIYDNPEVYNVLHSFAEVDTTFAHDLEIFNDELFNIELPEYRHSKHPFLSSAEDIYNSCAVAMNILSNYDVWQRLSDEEDDVVPESTSKINLDYLSDSELKQAATDYRDGVVEMLMDPESMDDDNNPSELLKTFEETIVRKSYKYYTDPDSFYTFMEDDRRMEYAAVEERFQNYLNADSDTRLGVMLNALSECETFSEQCALFCCWANCEESQTEDEWIIAVGTRLMDGNHYSSSLYKVWLIWRPMCQIVYYGLSKDSEIPNRMYNEYRAKCYKACLKQISNHVDDKLAMNSAAVLAGRNNILRHGEYPYGNQSTMEMVMNLPERYKEFYSNDENESVNEDDEE